MILASTFLLTAVTLAPVPAIVPPFAVDTACQILSPQDTPAEGRLSPLDSLTFSVAGNPIKVCYGRPSSRGRTMIGGENVPYGQLWRTGANEPTIFFTPVTLSVAGLKVPPGKYSLYTVPGKTEWTIIVNRSTSQWGYEGNYTDEVKAQELGHATVQSEPLPQPLETFTIRAEPASDAKASDAKASDAKASDAKASDAKALILEWEKTRVRIPIAAS